MLTPKLESLRLEFSNSNWLTLAELIQLTGWTSKRIKHYRRYCYLINGPLRTDWDTRRDRVGRTRKLKVHFWEDADRIMREQENRRRGLAENHRLLSPKQLAAIYKRDRISEMRFKEFGYFGSKLMDGRRLTFQYKPATGGGRHHRILFDVEDASAYVREYVERRDRPLKSLSPTPDSSGQWWYPTAVVAAASGCSDCLLYHMYAGRFPTPGGVKLIREPRSKKRTGERRYNERRWLEGPVRAMIIARTGEDRLPGPPSGGSVRSMIIAASAVPVDKMREDAALPQSKTRKRGRPRGSTDTDPQSDRRIAEAWDTGNYANKAELARAKGWSELQVRRAIWRNKKRRA